MTTLAFVLGIVVYMIYRFAKKRRGATEKKPDVKGFEDAFKETYGTTWTAWTAVKRDMLGDEDAFLACITSVFDDMYCTQQEMLGGVKK